MSGATNRSSGLAPAAVHHPRHTIMEHIAAVKAVSWCPWQRNTLATGGGTADRTIRIWNASNGTNMRCVNTGSQVCAIQWSEHHKELVSSHGFSDNQLILWKYPNMTKVFSYLFSCLIYLLIYISPKDSRVSWTFCSSVASRKIPKWNNDLFCIRRRKYAFLGYV